MKESALLMNERQAWAIVNSLWSARIKPSLREGQRLMLTLREPDKSREQEEKYHALIGEIAAQAQHLGASWDAESWKRLLLDRFAKDTDRQRGRLIPNLTGDGVVEVGLLSRRFTVKDGSDFIEWLHAWGAENGVEFSE